MPVFIAIPIFLILLLIQTTIASRVLLLHGTVDLFLLAILAWALQKKVKTGWHWAFIGSLLFTVTSALPLGTMFLGYGLSTGVAIYLKKRIWQIPLIAMFVVTFIGTLLTHGISFIALRLLGNPLPINLAFSQVTIPSLVLNLLMSVPIFALVSDLARFVYPETIET
jgi:rod shape-determining protein MreD